MLKNLASVAAAAVALSILAVPAHAQGSDSYKLLQAIRKGDGAEVDKLLATPNSALLNTKDRDNGETALHIVTGQRNLGWLNFLLTKGARIDLQNGEGSTPLAVAAQLGWLEGAERLLERKASVDLANRRGETPLILAVHRRDVQMVRLLLSKGADPKKADRVAGYSALDYAKRDPRAAIILKALEAPPAPANPLPKPAL
ncbi:MAG TPA: ankyrin repeat domain-containing protein [Allosphingosinicella sp.]|nr:ankyrin repeat domain-containing protein [Allosphingosinicella sp.]